MKARLLISIAIVEAAFVLAAVYFEPSHCVRGWLHGEAFFDGRPTSYWRGVVERDLQIDPLEMLRSPGPPGLWSRFTNWVGLQSRRETSKDLIRKTAADEVLIELRADPDEKIAAFASDILDDFRKIEGLESVSRDMAELYWRALVDKHNLKHPRTGMFMFSKELPRDE